MSLGVLSFGVGDGVSRLGRGGGVSLGVSLGVASFGVGDGVPCLGLGGEVGDGVPRLGRGGGAGGFRRRLRSTAVFIILTHTRPKKGAGRPKMWAA